MRTSHLAIFHFYPFLVLILLICPGYHAVQARFFNVLYKGICFFKEECCIESSIPGDTAKLQAALKNKLFGQHIAEDLVVNAIAAHWNSQYARKPLTMSFHGYTGSGKNYVSQIIAESLYAKGMRSKYVKLFSAGIDFPEVSKVMMYKKQLYETVKRRVQECGKQLFIFDEVDHIPAGVLDGIKAVIDYHENVENVDYRQCIFIFLSNTGTMAITTQFLNLWRSGRTREAIQLSDFETMISQGAFNAEGKREHSVACTLHGRFWCFVTAVRDVLGGFFRSETIKNNLIDHYVPFLPMEREHVEMCIRLEFRLRGIPHVEDNLIDEVINFIEWGPLPENKFAKTGCKRVSQKVATIAFKIRRNEIDHTEL